MSIRALILSVLLATLLGPVPVRTAPAREATRATLANGLRVVIVPDALAPAVTVETNYRVGADETPMDRPGLAHAQEHMSFRGCAGVTADQIAAIYAQLGGAGNADTQQTITQYFTTVPAADLEVALRVDAACMQHIDDSASEWAQEKGAIEQEVARDLSQPTYKFITRLNENMFAGTPYAHDALGTHESFEATTADELRGFEQQWYTPNNAILVIAGDVDPQATLALVKKLYGPVPRRRLPPRPAVTLKPVRPESFTLDSNLPYSLAFVAYRLPGTDSPDFAATQIMADTLGSQRGDLYGLVPAGKALDAGFELAETYPKASVGFAYAAVPSGTDPAPIVAELRMIVEGSAQRGLPLDLVDASKRGEVAGAEFQRNSIPGLAAVWSDALAAEGRQSPDEDVEAIRTVTPDAVGRVAKQYLVRANSITATLVPKPSGAPTPSKGFGGGEQLTSAPGKPVTLPSWAATALNALRAPSIQPAWTDTRLPNGIRLIVKPETTSSTVTVIGSIRHEPDLEMPPHKEGVDAVLSDLFSYGTTTLDRLAFQKALDDIAAGESAGYGFSLRILTAEFSRGVQLLADNELHPALPADAFAVVRKQTQDVVAGRVNTPGYRANRALVSALLPPGDPGLREATPETVGALTLADVRQYYEKTVRPDLATIVVIGDVTPENAKAVVEQWFGGWKASRPKPDVVLPKVPPNKPSAVDIPDSTAVQASVVLDEEIGLTRYDPDYYALQLGNHVLGGGFYATRLYHDLRQEAGLVYTVENEVSAGRTRGTFSVDYGCDPANVAKARDLIVRDLQAMQRTNVSDAELHQAKALLLRQIPLRESSEDAVAAGLLGRAEIDLPLDEPSRAAARYLALTADEVRAAFAKWIRPGEFVQIVRGPAGGQR